MIQHIITFYSVVILFKFLPFVDTVANTVSSTVDTTKNVAASVVDKGVAFVGNAKSTVDI